MLSIKNATFGALNLKIYDFESPGDELPSHTHTADDVHISIVCRGSFSVFGDGWERPLKQGSVVDFEPGQAHAFKALEPKSRLINIVKSMQQPKDIS